MIGMEVIDMRVSLSVLASKVTLGRIFNVLWRGSIDNLGPVDTRTTSPIHRFTHIFI